MLKVKPISALKDNYIWLLIHPTNRHCVVVDPGDARPVLDALQKEALILDAILITHHHHDHTGGITSLLESFPVPVYGPAKENIPNLNHPLYENNVITFPSLELTLHVLDIPGHTLGHIAYYGSGMLFCGDTLFAAGCGRLFEGTASQMHQSLTKLANLPEDTTVYCAHEYTAANLRFATIVEPLNTDIQKRIINVNQIREKNSPSLPSTLKLEKLTNPFLRCNQDSVISSVQHQTHSQQTDPTDIFQALRAWKDRF